MGMLHDAARSKIVWGALGFFLLFLMAKALFTISGGHPPRQPAIETKTNATGLLQAIEGFYSSYETLPRIASGENELATAGEEGCQLLTVLLGKENPGSPMENKKQIRFLNVEETKTKTKGGLLYSDNGTGTKPEGLYDAWGRPFHVIFDSDYNQEIQDPLKPGNVVRNKITIIYSYGKDGKAGGEDDIKTW